MNYLKWEDGTEPQWAITHISFTVPLIRAFFPPADVGLRVNLSSSETFADLVVALGRSLQLARQHGHFPFTTVAEEVGRELTLK